MWIIFSSSIFFYVKCAFLSPLKMTKLFNELEFRFNYILSARISCQLKLIFSGCRECRVHIMNVYGTHFLPRHSWKLKSLSSVTIWTRIFLCAISLFLHIFVCLLWMSFFFFNAQFEFEQIVLVTAVCCNAYISTIIIAAAKGYAVILFYLMWF